MEDGSTISIEIYCFVGHALSEKKVYRKGKKQRDLNSTRGRMHHDSIRGMSLFAMKSGPSHPELASDRFAEIDLVTCMDDLYHSGSVYAKHRMELETLNSKIAKGIMNTIPAEFKRKINSWRKNCCKFSVRCSQEDKTVYQIFSFFRINKTHGHTMNLNNLLNVEVYNDNLKAFNQTWERNLTSF